MSELSQIVFQLDPDELDIVDREIVRELSAGCGTLEGAAQKLKRDEATIKRRMGALLINWLIGQNKLGRLANSADHRTGAGDHASGPPPLGGQQKSK
jgi:hypothetical protein